MTWLIIYIVGFVLALYFAARYLCVDSHDNEEYIDTGLLSLLGAVIWPVFLAIGLFAGIGWCIGKLGSK